MTRPHTQPENPGVTVVTVVRNGRATLEETLRSVRLQTWPDVEHVVVDGGSTDGTIELLEACGDRVRWTSEPDQGLYDAMNRGMRRIDDPSRYIVFLNADDVFHTPDALERALGQSDGEDLVYGRLERHDEDFDDRDVIGREVGSDDMLFGMRCHHQAMLCRRRVFDLVGEFDVRYRIAADYDWAVRMFLRSDLTRRFVPVVVSTMRRGGVSDRRYLESVRERFRIVRRHYPLRDVLRYAMWTGVGDYGRFWAQQVTRRLGLLRWARGIRRALRDSR